MVEGVQSRRSELQQHQRTIHRLTAFRTFLFAITAAVMLLFMLWLYRRIQQEMTRRIQAATEALNMLEADRQRDLFAVTLASIGDAVIVTDPRSRIMFLNDVAASLTGWTREEAAGQPCSEVFRIINQKWRQYVESPIDKVLRLGTVVGLAQPHAADPQGRQRSAHRRQRRSHSRSGRDRARCRAGLPGLLRAQEDRGPAAAGQGGGRDLTWPRTISWLGLPDEPRTPLTPVLATLGPGRRPASCRRS